MSLAWPSDVGRRPPDDTPPPGRGLPHVSPLLRARINIRAAPMQLRPQRPAAQPHPPTRPAQTDPQTEGNPALIRRPRKPVVHIANQVAHPHSHRLTEVPERVGDHTARSRTDSPAASDRPITRIRSPRRKNPFHCLPRASENGRSQGGEPSLSPSLRRGESTQATSVFAPRRRAGLLVHVLKRSPRRNSSRHHHHRQVRVQVRIVVRRHARVRGRVQIHRLVQRRTQLVDQ